MVIVVVTCIIIVTIIVIIIPTRADTLLLIWYTVHKDMAQRLLTREDIDKELEELVDWTIVDTKLHKQYEFKGFLEALDFMTRSSAEIERMNHHPEWLNVYNRVTVDLTTHDAGGITKNDVLLARVLDTMANVPTP